MTEWTRTANERLERWLDSMVAAVPPDTDPAEVREDLRAHVMMDLERAQIAHVTEEDVLRVTSRLGSPTGGAPAPARDETGDKGRFDRGAADRPDRRVHAAGGVGRTGLAGRTGG